MPKRKAKLILCSGKGGVGKSTVASAIATYFAGSGKRTLIVSSDPVQALSRIFKKPIGDKVTKLGSKLEAVEIDVDKIAKRVESEYKKIFVDALASWLDEETAKSLPLEILSGVDELLALDRIRHFVEGGYEVVVWDTSPTGRTLRLLGLSKKMSDVFVKKFGFYFKLLHPWQTLKSFITGSKHKPKLTAAFENLGRITLKIEEMLADARTELILVINPERLSILEAKQLREAAEEHNIAVKRVIINKMLLPCNCKFCSEKRKEEEENLELIKQEYQDLKLLTMPYLPYEILSMQRVKEYAERLFAD
jgi:arsenite-transporting ATPase